MLSAFIYSSSFVAAEVVDRIVAVVNNDVITLSDLDEEVANLVPTVKQANNRELTPAEIEELREKTLDNMIDLHLIEQKAKQVNIGVSEREIDKAYNDRRERMSLEPAEFRQELLGSGLNEETYRQKLRANILQNKVISFDVRAKLVITDEMILDYYNKEYTSQVGNGKFYLLQMGFTWEKSNDEDILNKNKEAASKRADRILNLAKEDQSFKTLATKFSDLPSASDGGDIGVFALDEMAAAMRSAVEDLKPGEISQIIETSAGYQFFKLLSEEDGDAIEAVPLESVKDKIRLKLGEELMKDSFTEWVTNLKDQAYIQKL